ncbi:MAG: hypothetical protein LBP19_06515 [Treponema sp.]|jgi:hypothetical protein|nr:hypothetical protein [Treponema sp.]
MPKKEFDNNNRIWKNELEKDNRPYLLFEPFLNDYWKLSPKIVFCNLETASGGDDASEWEKILTWETFKNNWMDLHSKYRDGYPNPTIWRSVIFAYILYERLNGTSRQCIEMQLKTIKDNILEPYLKEPPKDLFNAIGKERLENTIKYILYMNLQNGSMKKMIQNLIKICSMNF